jgi:hypothetical protein
VAAIVVNYIISILVDGLITSLGGSGFKGHHLLFLFISFSLVHFSQFSSILVQLFGLELDLLSYQVYFYLLLLSKHREKSPPFY